MLLALLHSGRCSCSCILRRNTSARKSWWTSDKIALVSGSKHLFHDKSYSPENKPCPSYLGKPVGSPLIWSPDKKTIWFQCVSSSCKYTDLRRQQTANASLFCIGCSSFHTSARVHIFFESDDSGGYRKPKTYSFQTETVREGLKQMRSEIRLWRKELKEKFEADPTIVSSGDMDIVWRFNNPENLEDWIATSDKDNGEGYSTCSLEMSAVQKAVFHGNLEVKVPKDGSIHRAGYSSMRCVRPQKSFRRDTCFDWQLYTHLVMRLRGDGRSYLINIATKGYFDITWNDIYHYVLYTRGGPYWQIAKIPFSKFFLGSKGRVQDKQTAVPLDRVTSFGITCCDKVTGPFHLELDYIGVEFDGSHTETFAYELYDLPKYYIY